MLRPRGPRRLRQDEPAGGDRRPRGRGRRASVLAARGGELEREFALRRRPSALRAASLAAAPATERRRLLGGRRRARRSGRSASAPAPRPRGEDAAGLFQALHGLYWLTVNLADGAPLLIVVDDLHWADRPDAALAGVPGCSGSTGCPSSSRRPCAAASPTPSTLLESITRPRPRARRCDPRRSTVDAVAALVTERLGSAPTARSRQACRARHRPATRSCSASCWRRSAADGVAPRRRRAPGASTALGPATVARSMRCPPRLADPESGPPGPRGRRPRARRRAAPRRGARAASTSAAAVDAPSDALAAAAILASGPAAGVRAPGRARPRSTTSCPPGTRHWRTATAAALLAGEGADAQRVAAHLRSASTRRRPGGRCELSAPGRAGRRCARGAAAEAIADLRRALLRAAAPSTSEASCWLALGTAERGANDPAAIEHLELAVPAIADRRGCAATALRELVARAAGRGRAHGRGDRRRRSRPCARSTVARRTSDARSRPS